MSSQQRTKLGVGYARLGKTASKPRTPDQTLNSDIITPKRIQRKTATIGQQLLGQMAEEHTQYLASLSAAGGVRQRHTRSAAIESVSQEEIGNPHKASNEKLDSARFGVQVKSKFFCDTIKEKDMRCEEAQTQNNKEQKQYNQQKSTSSPRQRNSSKPVANSPVVSKIQQSTDDDFLGFMDNYVYKLSTSQIKRPSKDDRIQQQQHSKLVRKLEHYQKKFKEMQYNNHHQMKKLVSRDTQMRNKIQRLEEHLSELSIELQQERLERKRFELLFSEFQSKMRHMKKPTPRYIEPQSFGMMSDESFKEDIILDSYVDHDLAPQSHRSSKKQSRKQQSKVKSTGKFFSTKRFIELQKEFSDEDI